MIIGLLLLSLLSGRAQQQGGPSSPAPAPAPSATYSDSKLGFTFQYPNELKPDEAERKQAIEDARAATTDAKASQALACVTNGLVARENPHTRNFGVLIIARFDLDCAQHDSDQKGLEIATVTAMKLSLNKLGKANATEARDYRLSGQMADFTEGSVDAANSVIGAPVYGEESCALVERTIVCWTALSPSRDRVRQILSGMVTLKGHPAEPLVPATFPAK